LRATVEYIRDLSRVMDAGDLKLPAGSGLHDGRRVCPCVGLRGRRDWQEKEEKQKRRCASHEWLDAGSVA
jgi:hypothetical protein